MSFQEFYEALTAAKAEKKSGKMYINVTENSTKKIANLLLREGEVLSFSYPPLSGIVALEKILSLWIDKIIFIPSTPDLTAKSDLDTPSIASILDLIKTHLFYAHRQAYEEPKSQRSIRPIEALAISQTNAIDLHKAVEQILKDIYGPRISRQLDKIAQTHPPKLNPHGFLEECEKKARLLLSEQKVHELFEPLYRQIK